MSAIPNTAPLLEEVTSDIWYDQEEDLYHIYLLWVRTSGNSLEHRAFNYEEAAQAYLDAAAYAMSLYVTPFGGMGRLDLLTPTDWEVSTRRPAAAKENYIDEPWKQQSTPLKPSSKKTSRKTSSSPDGKVKGASTS